MSDIAIRLDGLVLAVCLALGASVFLVIAMIAVLLGLSKRRVRSDIWKDARKPLLFGMLSAAILAGLFVYMEEVGSPVDGPDWIDWLSLVYLPLFIGGCVTVFRRHR
ncbi:MAG: hypothetical protein ABI898_00655 [Sphingomonadales bacterium]